MKVEKFKVLLYLKKSGLDKSGKAPVMGRITVNRTMAQFGCKLSCTPGLWNPRESRLDGKSREAVETNAKIEKLLLAVNSAFDSLVNRKADFNATDVKDLFQGSMETQMTLMKMTDVVCDDIKARIGIDRAKGTYPGYHYMRLTLGEFIEHRYKVRDLAFGQLTEQFIHDYQDFVTGEKGYAIDTVRHYLAILKKVCRLAYKKGYSEKCHFQHFALPKQSERTPRALSRESFEKIRDVEIPPYRKTHMLARDLFLFACYTGVSYADVVSITNENLYTDEGGALWLKYRRKKNEHRASVKLLPEALALLEKYKDDTRETLFPIIHHPNMKRHMKALAALAGIKDNLCYHQARHSFASLITLEAGVPIETISRMLGHSDISTTQVYARVSPKKLFEDMDKFIEATKDFKLTRLEWEEIGDNCKLSEFEKERLKAWTSVDNPDFFQVHFEGGGCIYGLGAVNQYQIQNGKEKIEWDAFFEKLLSLGLIKIKGYDKNANPIYQLKTEAYKFVKENAL